MGRPWWLIQWPPFPYHIDVDSSTQMVLDDWKVAARCWSNLSTKSSTSFHQYCSKVLESGHSLVWSLHRMHSHRLSNRIRGIPVFRNTGTRMYLAGAVVAHRLLRLWDSNFDARMSTPKNFSNSPTVVYPLFGTARPVFVKRAISCKWVGGNTKRKYSSLDFVAPDDHGRNHQNEESTRSP